MDWFTVDKNGLAKLLEKRGKAFAIYELVQNAWDAEATRVEVKLEPVPGQALVRVTVEDDSPDGFKNLAHAFTLFAESDKKTDPKKRGRFNLGEKLVLALCQEAQIETTTGTVRFDADGRHTSRHKRKRGSMFGGVMRMTRGEMVDGLIGIKRLIPPDDCVTLVNGELLPGRNRLSPVGSFEVSLPTEVANAEGYLRKTERFTDVTVHAPVSDEPAMLYEMGIPVVEFAGGEPWHVNVHQKVPLNMDRDNVTPAYLQTIRVLLANHLHDRLDGDNPSQPWIDAAIGDKRIQREALQTVVTERFGRKRASYDPSDPEANKQLMNEGYTVIAGGSLSKSQWERVKEADLVQPSGKLRPSSPYALNGLPDNTIHPTDYTPGQVVTVKYARALAATLLGREIEVFITNSPMAGYLANWRDGQLTLNLGRLGKDWFERSLAREHHELFVHEFAHAKVHDHLTREFANEVARLFAILVDFAITKPGLLQNLGYEPEGKL